MNPRRIAGIYQRTVRNASNPRPSISTAWRRLGVWLEEKYREILEKLSLKPGMLGVIFKSARCEINSPPLLKQLIVNLIDKIDWLSLSVDVKGTIYEELLQRSAAESARGAGQYFTPPR
jgi:type I restriction enzyme M protein